MSLCIILPTFNEAGHITSLVNAIFSAVGANLRELVVVDDDSPDGTAKLVRDLVSTYGERLVVIQRDRDRGLVASLNEGLRQARAIRSGGSTPISACPPR